MAVKLIIENIIEYFNTVLVEIASVRINIWMLYLALIFFFALLSQFKEDVKIEYKVAGILILTIIFTIIIAHFILNKEAIFIGVKAFLVG